MLSSSSSSIRTQNIFPSFLGAMEARRYLRVVVSGLAIRGSTEEKIPTTCRCRIKLTSFPTQTLTIPVMPNPDLEHLSAIAASFYLDEEAIENLLSSSCTLLLRPLRPSLDITVTAPILCSGSVSCWSSKKEETLGGVSIPVDIDPSSSNLKKKCILKSGWFPLLRCSIELHVKVKVEEDPRYVFEFDGQPELSPQIFQIGSNKNSNNSKKSSNRQPIFSCTFSRDRGNSRCASRTGSFNASGAGLLGTKEKWKERKGWIVIIHDLSGSKVAAASIVTPFVPTTKSDRVTKSNPGAWLILRSDAEKSWLPWGRLEAWREKRSNGGGLGCRFELTSNTSTCASSTLIAETVINAHRGGEFLIDTSCSALKPQSPSPCSSSSSSSCSIESLQSSSSNNDFCFNLRAPLGGGGFVMSTRLQGEGRSSKPQVQIAARHVSCVEDAAVYMALAAALDLSMDACLPFSKKLGKSFSNLQSLV